MTQEFLIELADYCLACLGFSTGTIFWCYFFRVAMTDKG